MNGTPPRPEPLPGSDSPPVCNAAYPFEELERAPPDDVETRTRLARALLVRGYSSEALAEIRRVIRVCNTWAPAWLTLGDLLAGLGRHEKAAAAFRRARAVDAYRAELRTARDAWHEGNARRAEQCYQRILQQDLSHIGALCGLAGLHLSAGRLHDAERLLRHALRQAAYFPSALRLLGQTHLEGGACRRLRPRSGAASISNRATNKVGLRSQPCADD